MPSLAASRMTPLNSCRLVEVAVKLNPTRGPRAAISVALARNVSNVAPTLIDSYVSLVAPSMDRPMLSSLASADLRSLVKGTMPLRITHNFASGCISRHRSTTWANRGFSSASPTPVRLISVTGDALASISRISASVGNRSPLTYPHPTHLRLQHPEALIQRDVGVIRG